VSREVLGRQWGERPLTVGIPHSPELVAASQEEPWVTPGKPSVPKRIHELPYATVEKHGAREAAGAPIDVSTDPRIPSHVYHVTTDKDAVTRTGRLKASPGIGGLGGVHAPVVSITTDRSQAMQIHKDLKFAARLGQRFGESEPEYPSDRTEWGTGLVKHLQGQSKKEGWEFSGAQSPAQLKGYGLGDWMTHYHMERWSKHPQRHEVSVNPVLLGEHWRNVDPRKVGIVRVAREDIAKTGAMVTDFDLPREAPQPGRTRHGLSEIRIHGDVRVRPPRARQTRLSI
jgi:hypothetical protein